MMDKFFMMLFVVFGFVSMVADSDAFAILSFLMLSISMLIKWYNYNGV